jgi:hypothetical protein
MRGDQKAGLSHGDLTFVGIPEGASGTSHKLVSGPCHTFAGAALETLPRIARRETS